MPNTTDITTGLRVPAQIPLDIKSISLSEVVLSNLGNNNNLAFTYYEGLVVYCQEEETYWVWKEANNSQGLLEENFQYPINWIVNGIDYSEKEYNFYKKSEQNNKFRFIDLGVLIGGRGVDTSDPLVFEQLIISNLNQQFSGFPLTVKEDELIIFKVQVTEYGTFYTHKRKYFFPNMLGKGTYAPLSSAVNANQLEIAFIENVSIISSPEIIEESPNNVIFDLGNITGQELLDYLNTVSVPELSSGYNLTDTNKIYYFRFIDDNVTYLYYFDAENSLNGYGQYGVDGQYLFEVDELVLMFDSTTEYPVINVFDQNNIAIPIVYTLEEIGAVSFEDDISTLLAEHIANQNITVGEKDIYIFEVIENQNLLKPFFISETVEDLCNTSGAICNQQAFHNGANTLPELGDIVYQGGFALASLYCAMSETMIGSSIGLRTNEFGVSIDLECR
jgi:hypothetical protein